MVYENENEVLPSYQFQQVQNYYQPYDQQAYYYPPQMMHYPYDHIGYPNMYGNGVDPRVFQQAQQQTQQEGATTNSNVMQQFLDENGNVDVQKMLQTVGQLADTVQQVSPVIRQLNDLVRSFRA